jgi:hypothetical protein
MGNDVRSPPTITKKSQVTITTLSLLISTRRSQTVKVYKNHDAELHLLPVQGILDILLTGVCMVSSMYISLVLHCIHTDNRYVDRDCYAESNGGICFLIRQIKPEI